MMFRDNRKTMTGPDLIPYFFLYINRLDDIIVLNTSCLQLPVAKKQVWLIMTKMWILLLPAFCAVYVSVLMHNITYIRKI